MVEFICILMTVFLLSAVAMAEQNSDYPPKIEAAQVLTYKKVGDVELKLWVINPNGHTPSDSSPAIVFFFGGGWTGGTPLQFEPHARYLATRGMVAILVDYRVASRNKTTPAECVKDGCSAMRYVRSHAKELGIDPNRIAAAGGSAGGHVAAATATVTAFTEQGEDTTVSAVPNALVMYNPVYDNGPKGYGHDRVKGYWQKFSPIDNIAKGIPPSVTFLGTKDELIPVETAKRWKAEVEKVGGRADVHFYEGAGHGFFNKKKGETDFLDTLEKTDIFIASLGWITGEPTLKKQ